MVNEGDFAGRYREAVWNRLNRPLDQPDARSPAAILEAHKRNLQMMIQAYEHALWKLKPGSSAFKTTRGKLLGLAEAIQSLSSEMGA